MKKFITALLSLLLAIGLHAQSETDTSKPAGKEAAQEEPALTESEKASLASAQADTAEEATVAEQEKITVASAQEDEEDDDKDDDQDEDDKDDEDDDDEDHDDDDEKVAAKEEIETPAEQEEAVAAATPTKEKPREVVIKVVAAEKAVELSPEIEAHLKEAHTAIATLKTDVEALRKKYYDTPRNSTERRTLRKHLDKLDKRIKKLEKHTDKIDKIWEQCAWCRGGE